MTDQGKRRAPHDGPWYDPGQVFTHETRHHQERYQRIVRFTSSSTKAAMVMLAAAVASLIVANTGMHEGFIAFWQTSVGVSVGSFTSDMTLLHIVNDILMALFFLLVGLEIKYETIAGELASPRVAILPIAAAVGGVTVPALMYAAFNATSPTTAGGWGIPTATDIAFALGIIALLGNRVPAAAKVLLSTLAVADDIIAILIIAVFYGHTPDPIWLAFAAITLASLIALNRWHVFALVPYLLLGAALWTFIYLSGIHSTVAGVLLAFTIPMGSRVHLGRYLGWSQERVTEARRHYEAGVPVMAQPKYLGTLKDLSRVTSQAIPPAQRLEHGLYPWVYFAILPLFAFANAGVRLVDGDVAAILLSPAFLGVFLGLLAGKPAGIMLAIFLVVKTGVAPLPNDVGWKRVTGIAIAAGVGFTMAIFVSGLAFSDPAALASAKLAILLASLLAGILGFTILLRQATDKPGKHT